MEKLPGVTKVIVRFKTRHCFVRFDPEKQSEKSLIKAVEKQGKEATVDRDAEWPRDKSG